MSRYIVFVLKDSDVRHAVHNVTLFLALFALAIGACNSGRTSDPNSPSSAGNAAQNVSTGTGGIVGGAESTAGSSGGTATNLQVSGGVNSATPCSGPTVKNGADLALLAGCTSISGNIEVSDKATDITDLFGLANLQNVDGNLKISAPNLTSIQALSKLTSVKGTLTISSPQLSSLKGLEKLASVDALSLINCSALIDLTGLSGLTTLTGKFSISNSDKTPTVLTSLQGLSSLTSVGKLEIIRAIQLPTCEAYKLRDKLGFSKDDDKNVYICGTADDTCAAKQCDIFT